MLYPFSLFSILETRQINFPLSEMWQEVRQTATAQNQLMECSHAPGPGKCFPTDIDWFKANNRNTRLINSI